MYTKLQNFNMLFLGYVRFLFVGGSAMETREAEPLLVLNPDVAHVYAEQVCSMSMLGILSRVLW